MSKSYLAICIQDKKASAHYPTAGFEAKKNIPGGVTYVVECVGGDCFFS